MKRKIVLALAAVVASFAAFADKEVVDGVTWSYAVTDDEARLTRVTIPTSNSGNVVIPSQLGGVPVTSIGDRAFFSRSGLRTLTISTNVVSVGSRAFANCRNLTAVTIPPSVTNIGDRAFYGCTVLESVTIPAGVTSIGDCTFYKCASLKSVTIPEGVTSIGNRAFYGCTVLESVTIPAGVASIGDYTFYKCVSLKSMTIPEGVTSIGNRAFYGCTVLESVTIPASVTRIGYSAFSRCTGLGDGIVMVGGCVLAVNGTSPSRIELSDDVRLVGDGVFSDCRGLTAIVVSRGNSNYSSDDYGALFNKDFTSLLCFPSGRVGEYVIPQSVTNICSGAFSGCSGLTSVEIPSGVTSIGYSAFYGCSGLMSVTIPESVTSIEDSTFYGCGGLRSVTIPEGVTNIGDSAFSDCTGLMLMTIPSSVTSIGDSSFSGCSGLASVTVPEGVTSIGYSAFYGCVGLRAISLPASVTSIGDSVFSGCSGMSAIVVDEGNQNFSSEGGVLFDKSLSTLICCPNGKIGGYAVPESVTSIGDSAFSGCGGLMVVMIPPSVTNIGSYAFCDCDKLTSATIPSGVTSIGYSAFSGCGNVKTVYVGTNGGDYAQRITVVAEMLKGSGFDVSEVNFVEANENGGTIGGGFDGSKKHVFSGVVKDKEGETCGLAQITAAKATKKGVKVSGFVMADDGKKYTLKSKTVQIEAGVVSVVTTAGKLGTVDVMVGEDWFMGEFADGTTIVSAVTDDATGVLGGTVKLHYFNDKNKLATKSLTVGGVAAEGVASGTVGEKNRSAKKFAATNFVDDVDGRLRVVADEIQNFEPKGGLDGMEKLTMNGIAFDGEGKLCGLAQIATAKATKKGVKVSGFVMANDGKKYTLKAATSPIVDGFVTVSTTVGKLGAIEVVVGDDGFRGTIANGMTIVSAETDDTTGILSGTLKLNYFNDKNKLATKNLTVGGTAAEGVASGTVGAKKQPAKSFVAEIE